MKVVVLAGGRGARLLNETSDKPKAMVEIGGAPILWHVFKHFEYFGFRDFVVAGGYRSEVIKDYTQSDACEFAVDVVDLPPEIGSGARLKQLAGRLGDETFIVAFCDAVSTVNIADLVEFHAARDGAATVAAVHPPPRFGLMRLEVDRVVEFREKCPDDQTWINGGYFVFEPGVLDLIHGDDASLEHDLLAPLSRRGWLNAFRHEGFWQCMDNTSDRQRLEELLSAGHAPWALWEDL
jgi:glucose-1-phosphate cytidylyltransferase